MLVENNKPYIAVFKLGSGEEFICRVLEETSTQYVVSKALILAQTSKGIQFVPIMMLADPEKDVIIPKPVIVGQPSAEIQSQYESLVTGIALPASRSIIQA
jgi:hypothetical protein